MLSTRTLSAALALCALASPAGAQVTSGPIPPRPPEGIYRGDQRDSGGRDSLSLTASVYEVHDDNLLQNSPTVSSDSPPASGFYTNAQAGLYYARSGRQSRFAANGNARLAYYPKFRGQISQPVDSYDVAADFSAQAGRVSFAASQSLAYQPYFMVDVKRPITGFVGFFTTAPLYFDFTPQVSLLDKPALLYSTAVTVSAGLGRRSSIQGTYSYQGGAYSAFFSDINAQAATLQYNHSVGRTVQLHASYAYELTDYQRPLLGKNRVTSHDGQGGFSYRRALSRTRSVGFDLSLGGASLNDDSLVLSEGGRRRQVNATSAFTLQFQRSWTAQAAYHRSLQLLQGLGQPYYGDDVNAGVHGELTRRLDVSASAAYAQASIGIDALSKGYDTRSASARLRYALTRDVALSAEYLREEYSFGPGAVLPANVLRVVDRNSFRFGVVYGTSLIRRRATQPPPNAP